MNMIEFIEFRTAMSMFNKHLEENTNKKCVCHYCETFRKVLVFIGGIDNKHKYNRI